MRLSCLSLLGLAPWLVNSLADTDSISDADPPQTGYLPNHNMQPAIVSSPSFGILWTNTYGAEELWYAKPLVYTPNGQKQMVFTASNQNWIRTVDAVTGAPINARQVQPPFLQSDIGCTDIPNTIGITGTPIIDPATDTVYFFAKGYKNNAASGGVANGIYKFYAVNILDLTDRPGFPILIDGHCADNDPTRCFIGGTVLQRPSLAFINGIAYGSFGGHCDLFNYTGMIAGIDTSSGAIKSFFAMESGPFAPPVVTDITVQQGGKAGIWMGGMAPATDGSRLFLTTGNGMGHENKDTPASGRAPLGTLDEVLANFDVTSGKLALQDYFEPYEYIGMDAGDRDLGSGGVSLLDPTVFKGTGVSRIAITIGKNGKLYICNADNLGGFKLGPGGTDNIISTIPAANAVFGGSGSYPLEGGFIYFTPIGAPTLAYKLGFDDSGGPLFTQVGQTPDVSAGRVGVGVPTITTYQGQEGTGILWVTDVDTGLKAYNAVPGSDQKLVKINIPPTGGLNKFQRPAFGDGRLYVTDNAGHLICMGSPVSLPLNCTSPLDFGNVNLGSTKTLQVQCTALIAITNIAGASTGDPTFQVQNSTLPKGALKAGDIFSFPVTWNLTGASSQDDPNASFGHVSPGVKSSSLVVKTVNAVAKYSDSLPIGLSGTEVSQAPFLVASPAEVDFGGLVAGSPGAASGIDSSAIIQNAGSMPLKITGYGYADDLDDDGQTHWTNVTTNGQISTIGDVFTSSSLPPVGTIVAPGQSITVPVNFQSNDVGNYQNFLEIWTNGGNKNILMTGSVTTAPIAKLSVETDEGGWLDSSIMAFGTVTAGTTETRRIRICNTGGSALLITKSKPPIDTELRAENPTSDLHEGQSIPINECAYGPVDIAASPETPNVPSHDVSDFWILNTNDLTFGVHDVAISATIVSRQLGPTYPNGTAEYEYLGCYADGTGRQLQTQFNLGNANENGACQTKCQSAGYIFAGTEYHTECWCGNLPPSSLKYTSESQKLCTFGCSGDSTQACGGDGTYISIYYDSSRYTPNCGSIPCTSSSSGLLSSTSTTKTSTSSSVSLTKTSSSSTSQSSSKTSSSSNSVSSTKTSSSTSVSSTTSSSSATSKSSSSVTTITSHSSTPTSATSTSSSSSSITSKPTSSSSSTTSSQSSTSTSPASKGPFTNPGNSVYSYVGCYQDGATARAISPSVQYANDSMTVAVCLAYCKSQGTVYAGVEYHRECYCGNSILPTAIPNVSGCVDTCMANATEYCGGANRMNLYQAISSSSTTSSSSSTSSSKTSSSSTSSTISSMSSTATSTSKTSSSLSSSSSSVSSTKTSSSSSSSSTFTTSTSKSSSSSSSSSTSVSTTPSATPTHGFLLTGCYLEPPNTHAMKLLLANDSMVPDLCISAAQARLTATPATTYKYLGLEYGRECYGATAPVTSQTSLVGNQACTMTCMGNTIGAKDKCGGPNMYDYYETTALTGGLATQTSGIPVSTTGTV